MVLLGLLSYFGDFDYFGDFGDLIDIVDNNKQLQFDKCRRILQTIMALSAIKKSRIIQELVIF